MERECDLSSEVWKRLKCIELKIMMFTVAFFSAHGEENLKRARIYDEPGVWNGITRREFTDPDDFYSELKNGNVDASFIVGLLSHTRSPEGADSIEMNVLKELHPSRYPSMPRYYICSGNGLALREAVSDTGISSICPGTELHTLKKYNPEIFL